MYSMYTSSLSIENYFSVDMYQKHTCKVALTRFRCANHNLAINKLRPTHDRVDRICKYCHENNNVNIIEDEYHFIFICPLYTAERSFHIQSYFSHPSQGSMYIIPLFDSFKQAYYTVITVCVCVCFFQLCAYTVLHMGPKPLMQINILLLYYLTFYQIICQSHSLICSNLIVICLTQG